MINFLQIFFDFRVIQYIFNCRNITSLLIVVIFGACSTGKVRDEFEMIFDQIIEGSYMSKTYIATSKRNAKEG